MATIQIADDDARVQYTQAVVANTTQLTIDFPFFDLDDLNVIVTDAAGTDTTLSRGTGTGTFAVVGVSVDDGFSGGYVTLGDSYSAGTDTFTIFRDIPVQRTTDFPTSGPFNISSLNTELDKIIAIEQELETKITRTLQLADSDTTVDLKLPNLDTRKGTTLAFNATTGEPEAGPTISGVNTVAALAADIATLADIEDGTVATDAISDAAAIASDITTVSGISSNVSAVAGNASNINAVNANSSNINTVAGINANVTTVAGISSSVTTAAGISADITAVAADASDIGTVSSNISNVNTVAGISADVSTVAADGTDIGVVAGISSDVTTVSGISANVTTVAGISANVTAVAADATDIGTVATNIANVNTTASNIANVNTVAGVSSDVTTVATYYTDLQTVAADIASVITAANDLNEAVSEIDTVANSIANVDLVGGSIANVNTVASNLTDINSFANTYFISATAPSSPTTGDLWFDTTASTMKVYDGSGFVNAGSSVNGTSARYSYTATSGQTSFSATYDAGYVDVYLNGVKLVSGTDFTATDGSTVVLATGAALNDTVDIVGYGTFSVSSAVTLPDGVKASFGDGSDLQIYHDGSNSFVAGNNAGNNTVVIKPGGTGSVLITNSAGDNIITQQGDAAHLHYDNFTKLATTSTGVDVTGTATATTFQANAGGTFTTASGNDLNIVYPANRSLFIKEGTETHVTVDNTGNVGIGTTSPSQKLTIGSSSIAAGTGLFQQIQTAGNNMYVGIGSNNSAYIQANGEFRIATGGYTDRVIVDSSGNVGIGTSAPNANLHTQGSSTNLVSMQVQNTEGTGSRLDMYAFGSSPAVQSAHRAAVYQWTGAGIDLWTRTGDLHFGTNNTERMRIDSGGSCSAAAASGNNVLTLSSQGSVSNTRFVRFNINGSTTSGTEVGSIQYNGTGTSYITSSDYRLKENVVPDWDATTRLKQLNPVRFNFISNADITVDGFLAHEVQDVVPEAISGTKDGMRDEEYQVSAATGDIYTPAIDAVLDEDGNEVTPAVAEVIHSTDVERPEELAEGQQWRETTAAVMGTRSVPDYQGIDQSKLVPLLVKTIQELEARITALENV